MTYDPFEHAPPVSPRQAQYPGAERSGSVRSTPPPIRTPSQRLSQSIERTGYPDVVIGLAVLAAAGAALAGTSATGLWWWDPVLAAALAGCVTLAASTAKRTSWVVLGGIALAFGGVSVWAIAAVLALGLAIWSQLAQFRDPVVGAASAALALQALLRLPQNWFFGLESVLATLAVVPVLVTGYRFARRRSRRRARVALQIAGGVVGFLTVLAAVVFLDGRGPAQAGVALARSGLDSARSGDVTETVADLEGARRAFVDADAALNARWALPVRLLPVAGPHLAVLGTAAAEGADLSEAAGQAVQRANIAGFSLEGGRVDVGLLSTMAPDLTRLADEMVDARSSVVAARSEWVVPPVNRRIDQLIDELDRAIPEADLASHAADAVPRLLGGEQPVRWMVIFGSPSEMRELGGFMGSWAVVEAAGGQLTQVGSGRAVDLYDLSRSGTLDHPDGYPDLFIKQDPVKWPQNLTGMPIVSEVNRAAQDLFPELLGAPIDGAIYLDPFAVAGLLELTGGIRVDGVDVELTSDNVADFLTRTQYELFPEPDARFDFLERTLDATFAALTQGSLPGPERLGAVFGPLAREGRLQVATADPASNEFLERVLLNQTWPEAGDGDFLAVVHANGTQTKLDTYVARTIDYRVNLDPDTGAIAAEVRVELSFDAPDGLPAYVLGEAEFRGDLMPGDHLVLLSIYTPHELQFAAVDDVEQIVEVGREFGRNRYLVPVTMTIGERTQAEVRMTLAGTAASIGAQDGRYVLAVPNQPLVQRDTMTTQIVNTRTGAADRASIILDQDVRFESTVLE